MARPLRIQYSGAVYHVTSRGNERRKIFKDDQDRKAFIEILGQSLKIYHVVLYSYILMNNHFHLLIETPLGNLGEFMRHFTITYTSYFNRRHKRVGHLYQGRYKSILVDKDAYLSVLSRYIHLNPVRIKQVRGKSEDEKKEIVRTHQWSSLPGYTDKRKKEENVEYGKVLREYGGDNDRGREAYRKRIREDIAGGLEIKDKIIGQSILGGEEFIAWIKDKYLKGKKDRECPPLRVLQRYRAKEEIMEVITRVTGKGFEEIKEEGGTIRQVAFDVLYRMGRLKGVEIGKIFGIDYSTVSQGRKRLREKMQKDQKLRKLVTGIEQKLSM
jgi:putative transposase